MTGIALFSYTCARFNQNCMKKSELKKIFKTYGYRLDVSVYPFDVYKDGKEVDSDSLPKHLCKQLNVYYDKAESTGIIK